MILTRDEILFLDVYCHEGTEPPFGGPATNALTRIGLHSGDTLNLQWAYLRDKPPTGPVIGNASATAPPLPWPDREAVLRRDAEIQALREEMQRTRPGSVADAVGTAQVLRSGDDILAQVRAERDEWGDR